MGRSDGGGKEQEAENARCHGWECNNAKARETTSWFPHGELRIQFAAKSMTRACSATRSVSNGKHSNEASAQRFKQCLSLVKTWLTTATLPRASRTNVEDKTNARPSSTWAIPPSSPRRKDRRPEYGLEPRMEGSHGLCAFTPVRARDCEPRPASARSAAESEQPK
jgi:hypothetical protein